MKAATSPSCPKVRTDRLPVAGGLPRPGPGLQGGDVLPRQARTHQMVGKSNQSQDGADSVTGDLIQDGSYDR
jgi:hypothetical protein